MTDIEADMRQLLISVNQDLDKYFQTGSEYDRGYREGQQELLVHLVDIIKRYER